MILLNKMKSIGKITKKDFKTYLILLNPVCPHITEELWELCEFDGYLHESTFPIYDGNKLTYDSYDMPVQINGKVRAIIKLNNNLTKEEIIDIAINNEQIKKHTDNKSIIKVIYVEKKILNLVVK